MAPSSLINPTRLVPAMPSFMCLAVGFSRQYMMVSASSSNQFWRSVGDHAPTLLSHPASWWWR
jgi:hypothetical protein